MLFRRSPEQSKETHITYKHTKPVMGKFILEAHGGSEPDGYAVAAGPTGRATARWERTVGEIVESFTITTKEERK